MEKNKAANGQLLACCTYSCSHSSAGMLTYISFTYLSLALKGVGMMG